MPGVPPRPQRQGPLVLLSSAQQAPMTLFACQTSVHLFLHSFIQHTTS